jgi:hypothetical protein
MGARKTVESACVSFDVLSRFAKAGVSHSVFHSVLGRTTVPTRCRAGRLQRSRKHTIYGLYPKVTRMAYAMHGSDRPWSSQEPCRKEKHGAEEREDTVDGNSHDAEGQGDQPNERVQDECE